MGLCKNPFCNGIWEFNPFVYFMDSMGKHIFCCAASTVRSNQLLLECQLAVDAMNVLFEWNTSIYE